MIEIVCPSCQARYQLPDGSIGPDGRKVSCSSCSHKWRAHAEGAAPEPAAAEPAAGPESAPETVAESASMAAVAAPGNESSAPSPAPPPAAGDREDQMAAIRQMLTDLKDSADAAPEPEPAAHPEPVAPTPTMRKRIEEDDEDIDPLKSRIDGVDKMGRTKKGEAVTSGYNAARLRRMHEKRAKKLQRSRERRKKSGAFMTGFTLMAMVTATMVGLYVLHPQIIAASPRMEPAMTEYVVTVDRYRVELNQKTAEWKEWLVERIGALGGDEG